MRLGEEHPRPQVFICYAREDQDRADVLRDGLEGHGFRVWIDTHEQRVGDWESQVREALRDSHFIVVLLSPKGVKSPRVKQEIELAHKLNKSLVPIRYAGLADTDVPLQLAHLQQLDGDDTLLVKTTVRLLVASGSNALLPAIAELQRTLRESRRQTLRATIIRSLTVVVLVVVTITTYLQLGKSDDILSSLSTQYVGSFPNNMRSIIETVRQAKRSLLVMTDVVAYGNFSNHAEFRSYLAVLEELSAKKIPVRMVVYGPKSQLRLTMNQQFANLRMASVLSDPIHQPFWRSSIPVDDSVLEKAKIDKNAVEPSRMHEALGRLSVDAGKQSLIDHLYALETAYRFHVQTRGIVVLEYEREFPVFCWVVDGVEAIISFITETAVIDAGARYGLREVSFLTRDRSLIDVIEGIVRKYEK